MNAGSVIIAHPIPEVAQALQHGFEKKGWHVRGCGKGRELASLLAQHAPDLLVSELRLGDGPCTGLLKDLRQTWSHTQVAVVTGHGSVASAVECYRLGIAVYLPRGVSAEQILASLCNPDAVAEPACSGPSNFDRLCWEYINRVVSYAGSISQAACLLGLDRRSLRRMLSNYAPPG